MGTRMGAAQLRAGHQVIERDGAILEITSAERKGNRVNFTARSLNQSNISGSISALAVVFVVSRSPSTVREG